MALMEQHTLENSITRFMVLQPRVPGAHMVRVERRKQLTVSRGYPAMRAPYQVKLGPCTNYLKESN